MADHFSGPRALADPVSDIADLYAFPHPERAGCLVLVLDVFPFAAASARFSDAIDYRIRLRPVQAAAVGVDTALAVGEPEYIFHCTFSAPRDGEGSDQLWQEGTCLAPTGEAVSFQVNDESGGQASGLRVFAGVRLDPFFICVPRVQKMLGAGQFEFPEHAVNTIDGRNVLSIVIEADVATVVGPNTGPLMAVVAETVTRGGIGVRLERMGRPEIKNFILGPNTHDTVNRDIELRDLYNDEDAFKLAPHYLGAYRARLDANLTFYDGLDGKPDWRPSEGGNHPLTELLLADFLVVDVSKPYHEASFFEIERAMLQGVPHETCGGRSLNDDVIDTLLTVMVNGGKGPRISDGLDHATVTASRVFPYLAPPRSDPR